MKSDRYPLIHYTGPWKKSKERSVVVNLKFLRMVKRLPVESSAHFIVLIVVLPTDYMDFVVLKALISVH